MILTIIGVIVLIVVLILLLILFIPFHISFYMEKCGSDVRGLFQLRWFNLPLLKREIPSEEEEKEKKERKYTLNEILDVLQKFMDAMDYLFPVLKAFKDSLKIEKISLHLYVGLGSTVTTAQVSGLFWSIVPLLNLQPPLNLSLTPDFKKNRLDGTIDFAIKLTLYRIVSAMIRAFTKKPVRELIGSVRKLNK